MPKNKTRRHWITNRAVKLADVLARWIVCTGGIGTICAVLGVCLFLVWVAFPLLRPARITFLGSSVANLPLLEESQPAALAGDSSVKAALPSEFPIAVDKPSADVERPSSDLRDLPLKISDALIAVGVDEGQRVVWCVDRWGRLALFRARDGRLLVHRAVRPGHEVTAVSVDARQGLLACGLRSGKVVFVKFTIAVTSEPRESVSPDMWRRVTRLGATGILQEENGVWWLSDDMRGAIQVRLAVQEEPEISVCQQPIVRLDFSLRLDTRTMACLAADGNLHVGHTEKKVNFLTGEETLRLKSGALNLTALGMKTPPAYVLLSGVGDSTYLVWQSGRFWRCDTRDVTQPRVVEKLSLIRPEEGEISAMGFLIGKVTLLVGTSQGGLTAWFPVKPPNATTADGIHLVRGHVYRPGTAAVKNLGGSQRSRIFVAGYEDGTVRVYHATSEQLLAQVEVPTQPRDAVVGDTGAVGRNRDDSAKMLAGPRSANTAKVASIAVGGAASQQSIVAVSLAPKDDGVMAWFGPHLRLWRLDASHAGVTWKTIFGKVWYEGYVKPEFVWQSTGGTDDFEPKYSLTPLAFGTLKATVFALLFAVPIAFLAAIYTSEILHRDVRTWVKPTIELMAGLPSVVLGFLAALIFAPWVEARLPSVLAIFYCVPFFLLLGGHVTNIFPLSWQRVGQRYRMVGTFFAVLLAMAAARGVGPVGEHYLFSGNIDAWLDRRVGRGEGGWFLALLPLAAAVVAWVFIRLLQPRLDAALGSWTRTRWAMLKLGLFLAGSLLACLLAWGLGWLLVAVLGWDPRDLFLGTYVQRNAFVVGLVMGFAVIPLIYTIADDALSAVPQHLRAASLAAGATPWQTAIRIVIPTAASGLFSALMIGLGRAAGETMIVLMAAGNTPIMDWNIFNGFRTLSANIAVELPEAVQNSTHYRMLFLAALCLFVLTFVVNTVAEAIRLKFRKTAYEL